MAAAFDTMAAEIAASHATLKLAGAYNRSLIEVSLDPLVTIDAAGTITDVNAATEKVTGYGRDDLVGTDFCDYFTDPGKARAGYEQVFREGTVRDYELEIRHRDGHTTPVLYNASVYRNDAGEVAANALVEYAIATLDFYRDTETLQVRPDGMWEAKGLDLPVAQNAPRPDAERLKTRVGRVQGGEARGGGLAAPGL